MGFKLNLPQSKKQTTEMVAKVFCSEIRKISPWLKIQIYKPYKSQNPELQIHLLRDKYHCNRGSGYCGHLVELADRVSYQVLEIAILSPDDWNNYRLGQKFRWLDEYLARFEIAWSRSRQTPSPPDKVVPSRMELGTTPRLVPMISGARVYEGTGYHS